MPHPELAFLLVPVVAVLIYAIPLALLNLEDRMRHYLAQGGGGHTINAFVFLLWIPLALFSLCIMILGVISAVVLFKDFVDWLKK